MCENIYLSIMVKLMERKVEMGKHTGMRDIRSKPITNVVCSMHHRGTQGQLSLSRKGVLRLQFDSKSQHLGGTNLHKYAYEQRSDSSVSVSPHKDHFPLKTARRRPRPDR